MWMNDFQNNMMPFPGFNHELAEHFPKDHRSSICHSCGKPFMMIDELRGVEGFVRTEKHSHDKLKMCYGNAGFESSGNCNICRKGGDNAFAAICAYINENMIGKDTVVSTPYGFFKVIYLDFTASGRNVKFIEAFIRQHLLPIYANTHSVATCCVEQTEKFREEARDIIRTCVNARKNDVVLFTGSGCTGAIAKLIEALNIKCTQNRNLAIVLSAMEHHSNYLPWKESGAEVIRIPFDDCGDLDVHILRKTLKKLSSEGRTILCAFTAASNVSGIIIDTKPISSLVHSYNGFIFWDYAASAPYVKIDMNPSNHGYSDAIFISGHKFIGGPGTPGILIAKDFLFKNSVPTVPGGGTVIMVTKSAHLYVGDIERREEGGTPDIIGSIRAGLVFQLKRAITDSAIECRDQVLSAMYFRRFKNDNRIITLGGTAMKRLPIFSFLIVHQPSGLLLHHTFVSRLLNDLFGIQSRPGCVCAGPYGQDLLNINEELALKFASLMTAHAGERIKKCNKIGDEFERDDSGLIIMRPGFTRLNLPFFFADGEIKEILNAVHFVVENGWRFLPQYKYNVGTAKWEHRTFKKEYNSLHRISYADGRMCYDALMNVSMPVSSLISNAMRHLKLTQDIAAATNFEDDPPIHVCENLRWFLLPSEAARLITKGIVFQPRQLPFVPLDGKSKLMDLDRANGKNDEKDKVYVTRKMAY
ncbi:hypothetical protein ACOME3_010065 [Neoechinorhynchus agilis]